ncbi:MULTISPECIES: SDR family NAD(P)-dependent oxidoreductase [Stappiaceae]|jgi:serine 3-dehydrogenase|uniref:SDR family NAD(P)-dependent oxidoreductase n=1 Tax=Stappiaceae TaxID=2821832 RepID=UPI0012685A14|nr:MULTISPECIES: SDR family NAD(P)-dependent oxidoreductase [Stappiaceae]MBO6860403.1 SDR family NAD(P)-dependent oxidoreductase [Roseibium sp.]QFT00748.1 Serine 3-dehydrogenase [Labrenzia sp. THAF191b]QFT07061.1 Serine 3-dehydrogenase [Labrenzia sp. THAF191a]QFT18605.1 Serine 3-dehydrogenase [Labrenzia sp. THAF187b]UES36430.1 SDR family NAD(P)-dependent oxidoreductase [Roseibium aggregatum]
MSGTILITGTTSGFGQAMARLFVQNGWKVIGTGRRADRLEKLKTDLGEAFHALVFDIMDEAATTAALAGLPEDFQEIDILVNNAGLALGTASAPATKLSDWKTMIDTNITGLVTITDQLLPKLIERKGMVVNISSIAANWPYPGGNVYAGTKAFLRQFSLGLRSDLHGKGVRVTSIEPGLCESEFTLVRTGGNQESYDALYGGANAIQPEDIASTVYWVATQPPHLNINSLELMPVSQSWAGWQIAREG